MSEGEARLKDLAVGLLARREHSRRELERKLKGKGAGAESIASVLDQLAREGLQSDRRYAETYLDSRARKGYGPVRIRQELRERGIADSLIEASLDASATDWTAVLVAVREKKFGNAPPPDYNERARQARFLQYRGFSADQIRRAYDTED